jgi:ABC-type dipeptide/oligopeptide/nickel transport system permease component
MQRYILVRTGQAILQFIGVVFLAFGMLRMTGDPASLMMSRNATPEDVAAFREAMGFNRPVSVQFVDWVTKALHGDFGNSTHFRTPALPIVLQRLPTTMGLAVFGLLVAILIGVPIGLIGGSNPGSLLDSVGRFLALLGQSIPNFWLGLILILVFAQRLHWFPVFGADKLSSVVLPGFVLGLPVMGELMRLTRSAVLEVRGEDYIRTARSKGLNPRTIYIDHLLKNVAISLVSVTGVEFTYMLGGSIYIETIYAWPGMGLLLGQAVGWLDFTVVQTIAIFTSLVVITLNLLTDLAYALLDPRIRHG